MCLVVSGCAWWGLVASGRAWGGRMASGGFWRFWRLLVESHGVGRRLVASCCARWRLVVSGCVWWRLAGSGGVWWRLVFLVLSGGFGRRRAASCCGWLRLVARGGFRQRFAYLLAARIFAPSPARRNSKRYANPWPPRPPSIPEPLARFRSAQGSRLSHFRLLRSFVLFPVFVLWQRSIFYVCL